MTTYLSLNGTSDYIQLPTMTFDEIVMTISVQNRNSFDYYLDARTGTSAGYLANDSNGNSAIGSLTAYFNGIQMISGSNNVPNNQKGTLDVKMPTSSTDNITVFARYTGIEGFMTGSIYDIKIYNGATLVAHYDLSTGTVQDVSGNGNHATLTGGTWLDDGTGGTGTTYSGTGTSAGISSLTSSEKVIQSASGSVQGNSSLASAEKAILSASGTVQGNSSLSSSETVISHTGTTYSGSGTAQGSSSLSTNDKVVFGANVTSQGTTILSPGEHLILPSVGTSTGQSSLTSNETVVGHGTTTYSGSGQAQGSSSLSSVGTMSYTAAGTAQGLSSLIAHEIIRLLASGISEGYSTVTFIDKSNQIIGTIHLKGSQVLNVNLKGGI